MTDHAAGDPNRLIDVRKALLASSNRVQVAQLARQGKKTVSLLSKERMADLVDSALEPFRGKDRQRVHASGPNLPVAPQSAVMISMMLHELATNAAKYGALSNDTGEVFVDWRLFGEGSSQRMVGPDNRVAIGFLDGQLAQTSLADGEGKSVGG